ncbi:MAG: hypothetical protein AAB879_03315 [Patescibacteria group bacterium]
MADRCDVLPMELCGPCKTLLEKLCLPSHDEGERVRRFLLHLATTPFVLRPATHTILSRVRAAIFWCDCQSVRLLCGTEEQQLLNPEYRIDLEFEEWLDTDFWQVTSSEFWSQATSLIDDHFLLKLDDKFLCNFREQLHPSLVHDLMVVIVSFVDLAIASHVDLKLLQRGKRFEAFFDLYFGGTPVIAYDTKTHEATVLVASSSVN